MSKSTISWLSILALVVVGLSMARPGPGEGNDPVDLPPEALHLAGVGTSPSFSDWIDEPRIANGPVQEVAPDVDRCPGCPPGSRQENSITGGSYGFDADRDGTDDEILTAEKGVIAEVRPRRDGGFLYDWTFENLGTGAATRIDCGPNAPSFAISEADPLLGTAGVDRLSGTDDDLPEGETLTHTETSDLEPKTVLCAVSYNPTTPRELELLVPLPDSPTRKEQCKKGGWADFDFRNQGRCIRFVETGKDSR